MGWFGLRFFSQNISIPQQTKELQKTFALEVMPAFSMFLYSTTQCSYPKQP